MIPPMNSNFVSPTAEVHYPEVAFCDGVGSGHPGVSDRVGNTGLLVVREQGNARLFLIKVQPYPGRHYHGTVRGRGKVRLPITHPKPNGGVALVEAGSKEMRPAYRRNICLK